MHSVEELIQKSVTAYINDEITWQDIQDDVEVYVMKLDGKGCKPDINVVMDRFFKESEILSTIRQRINEEVK